MNDYTRESCINVWLRQRQIEVPFGRNGSARITICRLIRAITINDLPLDVLIVGQTAAGNEPFEFGVVFADQPPRERIYPIPIVWRKERDPSLGKIILPKSKV